MLGEERPKVHTGSVSSDSRGSGSVSITCTLAETGAGGGGKSGATSCITLPTSTASSSVTGGMARNSASSSAGQGSSIGPASPVCASRYQQGSVVVSSRAAGGSVCRIGWIRVSDSVCQWIRPGRAAASCRARGSLDEANCAVDETKARPVAIILSMMAAPPLPFSRKPPM